MVAVGTTGSGRPQSDRMPENGLSAKNHLRRKGLNLGADPFSRRDAVTEQIGRIVVWLLVAESGLLVLALGAYLAVTVIRGRDVAERVRSLEAEHLALETVVHKSLRKLSPGRPPKEDEEERVSHPLPSKESVLGHRTQPDDRATRLAAIRAAHVGLFNGRNR